MPSPQIVRVALTWTSSYAFTEQDSLWWQDFGKQFKGGRASGKRAWVRENSREKDSGLCPQEALSPPERHTNNPEGFSSQKAAPKNTENDPSDSFSAVLREERSLNPPGYGEDKLVHCIQGLPQGIWA